MSKLAVITGASSGIGLEIARLASAEGYDLIVASDTPMVDPGAGLDGEVDSIEADLATDQGVRQLLQQIGDRQVDVLVANAGHGLGHGFLQQSVAEWRHVIDTNITGTLLLIQPIAKKMAQRGEGRILITGSIAGNVPAAFQAVYHASKAFIDSFAAALGNELKDTGVTVTCLKPGATETEFFTRADMEDTKVGQSKKAPAADVAKTGWEAMKKGEEAVVHGTMNKLQTIVAGVLPESVTAEQGRNMNEPGGGK
jgi:short-subunit dehydrogenase